MKKVSGMTLLTTGALYLSVIISWLPPSLPPPVLQLYQSDGALMGLPFQSSRRQSPPCWPEGDKGCDLKDADAEVKFHRKRNRLGLEKLLPVWMQPFLRRKMSMRMWDKVLCKSQRKPVEIH